MARSKNAKRIAELNDRLRTSFIGGRVMMTSGVSALPEAQRNKVMAAVQDFSAFSKDNDPYGEHDFAVIAVPPLSIMFKIDYYDLNIEFASPDPADPAVTKRVLTIMLSEEY